MYQQMQPQYQPVQQMQQPAQSNNTALYAVLGLVVLALIWFVVIPMLKSPTAKAVDAVADAKAACDKALVSKLPADMTAAQTAIYEANALIKVATADEKAKGALVLSAELTQAISMLAALACNMPGVTTMQVNAPGSSLSAPGTSLPVYAPSATTSAVAKNWMFYPGLDSGGNDIGNFPGTLDEMKATCISQPTCLGFNDNGWMKNTLIHYDQWSRWTDDPNKGFRVYTDRVPNAPAGGLAEGFS